MISLSHLLKKTIFDFFKAVILNLKGVCEEIFSKFLAKIPHSAFLRKVNIFEKTLKPIHLFTYVQRNYQNFDHDMTKRVFVR